MTVIELGRKLREMYETKGANKVAMIHLFGVIYADEIRAADTTTEAVVKSAEMQHSYGTEVRKGINLAKYLTLKPEYKGKF